MERTKIQAQYSEVEERIEATAIIVGAMLHFMKGKTWQKLIDQILAELWE